MIEDLVQLGSDAYLLGIDITKVEKGIIAQKLRDLVHQYGIPKAITIKRIPHNIQDDELKLNMINGYYRAILPTYKRKTFFTREPIVKYLKKVWFDFEIYFEENKNE